MLGIDTNILVRYLTQDDPKLASIVTKFFNKQHDDGSIFINCIVLCELVWVLETAYEYNQKLIAMVLEKILQTKQFKIDNLTAVQRALQAYKRHNADFADHLIAEINHANGCQDTISFDKKAIKTHAFKLA